MKNVSVEMSNESLEVVAGLFDIATEGVEKEALVTAINESIEELKSSPASRAKVKWFEVENAYPFTEGEVVKIISGDILVGRFAEITRPSAKKDAVKAFLLTPKEGKRQGTEITMDFAKIEKSAFVPVAPKATKKEETETTEETVAPETEKQTGESQEPAGESQDTPETKENGEEVAV